MKARNCATANRPGDLLLLFDLTINLKPSFFSDSAKTCYNTYGLVKYSSNNAVRDRRSRTKKHENQLMHVFFQLNSFFLTDYSNTK